MSNLNTIEECEVRLKELEQLDRAYYAEKTTWNEEQEIKEKKKEAWRRSFIDVVSHSRAFKRRCLEEMRVSGTDYPPCLCGHQDTQSILGKFEALLSEKLGIESKNLLFAPHPDHPKEPILRLIHDKRGCYTFDNCLEALRQHMKLLLMSDSEREAEREKEKYIRNATDERILAMTEEEFLVFYELLEKEEPYSHAHYQGKEIRHVVRYEKWCKLLVTRRIVRMPEGNLLGWEHRNAPAPF